MRVVRSDFFILSVFEANRKIMRKIYEGFVSSMKNYAGENDKKVINWINQGIND